jgi:hypothetical protein
MVMMVIVSQHESFDLGSLVRTESRVMLTVWSCVRGNAESLLFVFIPV